MDIGKIVNAQQWHRCPAGKTWQDGALLGNGRLGVVASAPSHLEWTLNKNDIFDPTVNQARLERQLTHTEVLQHIEDQEHKNTLFLYDAEDAPHKGGSQPLTISAAIVRLRFWDGIGWAAPALPLIESDLSLYDGILDERLNAHGLHKAVRSFVPRFQDTLVLRCTGNAPLGGEAVVELCRPEDYRLSAPVWHQGNGILGFEQTLPGSQDTYAVAMRILNADHRSPSGIFQLYGTLAAQTRCSCNIDILVCVKSSQSYKAPFEAACRELNMLADLNALEEDQRKWWHDYWHKAYADFGNYTDIQRYFTFSLYELASTYGASPMPGLNGLSFGPLDSVNPGTDCQGYTHDQNAQIPAMPMAPLNHAELLIGLCNTYWNARETIRKHPRHLFGCAGMFLPLAMNQHGQEYPTRAYRYTICGSAYTGMVLSHAWSISRDEKLLEEHIYPLLREFVIFYCSLMTPDETGTYHLTWSVPPEIFSLTRDDNATIAMLKVCLTTAIEAAVLLHRDAEWLPRWRHILKHYPAICTRKDGAFWCGPDIPHDHYFFGGHLWYPFFPAAVCTEKATVEATFQLIEQYAIERSFNDLRGQWHFNHEWSEFLNTCAHIRAGHKKCAWTGIQRFLRFFAKENGLFSHDPILIADIAISEQNAYQHTAELDRHRLFCDGTPLALDNPEIPHPVCVTMNPDAKRLSPAVPEGSSSFLVMASEALLQSHDGLLRLFPSVPEDFSGEFTGFRAFGGYTVSASMLNGKIVSFSVKAMAAGPVSVQFPEQYILTKNLQSDEIWHWERPA